MVADSRSFLSFTRHEYFRRILCNLLGAEMTAGLLPQDFDLVPAFERMAAGGHFGKVCVRM
jgi:glucuronate isomerase